MNRKDSLKQYSFWHRWCSYTCRKKNQVSALLGCAVRRRWRESASDKQRPISSSSISASASLRTLQHTSRVHSQSLVPLSSSLSNEILRAIFPFTHSFFQVPAVNSESTKSASTLRALSAKVLHQKLAPSRVLLDSQTAFHPALLCDLCSECLLEGE